jgi:hypothetical protein
MTYRRRCDQASAHRQISARGMRVVADGRVGSVLRVADADRATSGRPMPGDGSIGLERSSRRSCRRSRRWTGSSGGNRRPEPHGQGSRPPSLSTSSVSSCTTRAPRLTWVSLEGTPGGACWSAQKDTSVSWSRYMVTSSCRAVVTTVGSTLAAYHPFSAGMIDPMCDDHVDGVLGRRGLRAPVVPALSPTLTEPETAPMTAEQRQHAVGALANMMLAWLRREAGPSP